MENLIGRKIRGFKFEDEKYSNLIYAESMDDFINEVGIITRYNSIDDFYSVEFKNNSWAYPAALIEQHLIHENIYPKVMEVSDNAEFDNSCLRVVFMEKFDKFIAWSEATTLEEAELEIWTHPWKFARDVSIVELTLQDISNGKGVGIDSTLIKIIQ